MAGLLDFSASQHAMTAHPVYAEEQLPLPLPDPAPPADPDQLPLPLGAAVRTDVGGVGINVRRALMAFRS